MIPHKLCFKINLAMCLTVLTWKALHTKRDKRHFYIWSLSTYKT